MKQNRYAILILAAALLAAAACRQEGSGSARATLVNPSVVEFAAKGAPETVVGVAADGAWSLKECPDWITVSPTEGTGRADIVVSLYPSESSFIPDIPDGSFAKKLYSTYLSYLPKEKVAFPLKMNVDDRGSFTELVHTLNAGQVSINISKPGITKGQHWHNTKWEFFIVVSGHGLIQERKLGTDEVIDIQAVHMLPGYTHNIINLSDTENLVTVMYCNEIFNPNKPDTYFEPVK